MLSKIVNVVSLNYLCEKTDTMNTREAKVQTGLRFSPALIARLKRGAKQHEMSFNSYVEDLLEKAVKPSFPALRRKDYLPDERLLKLGDTIPAFTAEQLARDPKLAYILSK